jgi:hypothetical protein
MQKFKEQLKMLITTLKGWFSLVVANIITLLPWFFSFDLLWMFNVTIALWVKKIWEFFKG